MSTIKLITC